mmetsp:Transcript_78049/g.123140  ORF Transcript_78049/g.123140 Transcript_78049/m.123140 type:complete len:709 (+) Transcript_78049:88-2214(+)
MSSRSQVVVLGLVALLHPQRILSQPNEPSAFIVAAPAPSPAGVSAHANKKITMVIDTLKDISQSVVNEEKQETALYNKYMEWCKSEKANIAQDATNTNRDLANAKVLSEEQVSSIDTLETYIKTSTKEIEETNDAVAQAVALRNDENEKYTEDMQINTQSIRQIDAAIAHVAGVQKQGGFLQFGVMKKLQINQPGESSYVLGVMKGLKDKLTKSKQFLEQSEADRVKMHDSLMATKSQQLKSMTDTLTGKKILYTETQAKEAGVKQTISKLEDEATKLTKSASETAETCSTAEQEWKVKQDDRTKEKAALNEAIRYLQQTSLEQEVQEDDDDRGPAPSFLQMRSSSQVSDAASEELQDGGSLSDNEVEGHMRKDTFNGVKSVVEKLISSHQDSQTEETSKKEYCEKEMASKEDEKAITTDALAAIKADIEKKSTEVVQLADEVKNLYGEIDKMKQSVEDAGEVRQKQHDLFVAGTKERTLAIRVLNQAMRVLQSFYDEKDKASLVQGGQSPNIPQKWSSGGRKTAAGFGAVSMIQDIADDIAKEQKDAAIAERQEADAYSELQEDSRRNTDDKHQEITDRVTSKAKMSVQINSLKESETEKTDELAAINKQLDALHNSCDELLKFYDKRKTARVFEVSQLKDVFDILSGSSIAARTGFLQDKEEKFEQSLEHSMMTGVDADSRGNNSPDVGQDDLEAAASTDAAEDDS